MNILIIILAFIFGGVVIFLIMNSRLSIIHYKYGKQSDDIKLLVADKNTLEGKLDLSRAEYHSSSVQCGELTSRCEELKKQIREFKGEQGENEERIKMLFENIATKIIDDRKDKMDKMGAEQLRNLLTPLGDNLERFKLKVEQVYSDEAKERHSLKQEIKNLVEANLRISTDATNLTKALRGNNKTQGDWGEMILESILESSGLVCGVEGYELQSMLTDDNGNKLRNESGRKMIPDAIVHFPDNRNVIIDSKVSISAYIDYCNSDNEQQQQQLLKNHITSIKSHIKELDVKSYENYVSGSLDFVMMFVPNESAYLLAMRVEPSLWNDAYKKKVLLISPTNLIASLRIVSDLWTREKQNKNIEDIIYRGEKIYEKCVTFLESMVKIDKALTTASSSYSEAYNSLIGSRGLVRNTEMLRELGIKSKKILPVKSKSNFEEINNNLIDVQQSDKVLINNNL